MRVEICGEGQMPVFSGSFLCTDRVGYCDYYIMTAIG